MSPPAPFLGKCSRGVNDDFDVQLTDWYFLFEQLPSDPLRILLTNVPGPVDRLVSSPSSLVFRLDNYPPAPVELSAQKRIGLIILLCRTKFKSFGPCGCGQCTKLSQAVFAVLQIGPSGQVASVVVAGLQHLLATWQQQQRQQQQREGLLVNLCGSHVGWLGLRLRLMRIPRYDNIGNFIRLRVASDHARMAFTPRSAGDFSNDRSSC
ncbi:hypothetical protein ACLKA7_003771 [Drosophila subpalustris]